MKSRLSFAALVALLSVTLPSFAQKNHVDISVRGPWILYVDSSKSFADWPVLIVMAPGVHDRTNPWAHQPPTISNGIEYVLDDLTQNYPPTDSQIYCLIFDATCARKGASALYSDDYPAPNAVKAFVPGWDWVSASRNNYAPTIVLPVPDSYSADTTWPMRFGPKFDAQGAGYGYDSSYSTGVVLHYTNGPTWFNLKGCPNGSTGPNHPNPGNCTNALSIKHTTLADNGSLRIDMKAPVGNWSCDPHVRQIYPRMLKLAGITAAGPNADWAVIDPAYNLHDDGSGVYDVFASGYQSPKSENGLVQSEFCLEHDSQGGYVDERWPPDTSDHKGEQRKTTVCEGARKDLDPWVGCVQQIVKAIPPNPDLSSISDIEQREVLAQVFREIRMDGSDPALKFPKLAQLRRLDDNLAFLSPFLGQLEDTIKSKMKKLSADQRLLPFLHTILQLLSDIKTDQDQYTKTHGDCGAPVMHLTDK